MHKFKTIDEIYDLFTAEQGSDWNDAYEFFPDYNDGGEDTDSAVEFLLTRLEIWLEEMKGYEDGTAHEFLYQKRYCLNPVFEYNAEGVAEAFYAGLT